MSGVLGPSKFVGSQVAAEVVAAAGGDMHGSEDFLVLNVSTGHRQHLRAKAKFAKFASDRVVGQLGIVRVEGSPVAADQCGACDAAAGDFLQAKRVPSAYCIGNAPLAPVGTK